MPPNPPKRIGFFLIIFIIVIPCFYSYIFINLNPTFNSLDKRAEFLSLPYRTIFLNSNNSYILDGSNNSGVISSSLEVPIHIVKQGFHLEIEAIGYREWNYGISSDLNFFYLTANIKIQIVINNVIERIISNSEFTFKNYYSILSYKIDFQENSSRDQIIINLITEHHLYPYQNIFDNYFIDDNYIFSIAIGFPDFIFNLITLITIIVWFFIFIIFQKSIKKKLYTKNHKRLFFCSNNQKDIPITRS